MNKNNYKKRISENNNNKNYHRCASVEERYNKDFRFSKNLEKEYLDIKCLVKNSVEKINTLFNNEEFKHKTTSKKTYNNSSKINININRFDMNKNNDSLEEEKKKDTKANTQKNYINVSTKEKSKNKRSDLNIKFTVNEEDEYMYNNNDLYEELKDLNSNKINKNNYKPNKLSSKNITLNDTDLISGSLLNLESNKLYANKEQNRDQNLTLKKLNLGEANKNRKYKNQNTSNYLKTEIQNDVLSFRDKKKDNIKYIQKGNYKFKKKIQNNNDNKTRNMNKPKANPEKNPPEEANKFSKTLKLKNVNNSLPKDTGLSPKNNSNSMLIDINLNINTEASECDKKRKKEVENKLLSPNDKINHRIKKRTSSNDDGGLVSDTSYKKKHFNEKIKKNIKKKNENNSTNNSGSSRQINEKVEKIEKIKINDFMQMMLVLNEYLIENNLFEDISNPENKKIMDNYSLFLTNNIKVNHENKIKEKKEINNKNIKESENDKNDKDKKDNNDDKNKKDESDNKENTGDKGDKDDKDNKNAKENKDVKDKEDDKDKKNNENIDKTANAAIVIQRRWRKSKIDKYFINNFIEEEDELRKMLLNKIIYNPKCKNIKIIDIFNSVINNFKLVYKNVDEVEKIFYYIQKIIQRKLNVYERNLLYKEYINKIIYNK